MKVVNKDMPRIDESDAQPRGPVFSPHLVLCTPFSNTGIKTKAAFTHNLQLGEVIRMQ